MESIKLIGTQIVDTRKMKQSGRYRITLELTEEDTKFNGGTLAVAEINDLLADVELKFTEIQGNNNNFEKSIIKEPKKERTMYQIFKDKCIEYSGEEYYSRLKKHLGIEHLKDLEQKHNVSMVSDLLFLQQGWINSKMYLFDFEEILDDFPLINKDNAINLWRELFNLFNNPKA